MFHPVGSQPPSVYWRRRLIAFGSVALLILLLGLTLRAVTNGNGDGQVAEATGPTSNRPSVTSRAPRSTASRTPSAKPSSTKTSSSRPPSSSTAPQRCQAKHLAVLAVVAKPTYQVGDQPVVELQVTNTGTKPCVQDLADRQIELKIYNGASRVWGSHDCQIQDGTDDRTLAVARPVRVSITWSGLTSQAKCRGTRQRVGAGTYTLYARLSGKTGKATQFAIN